MTSLEPSGLIEEPTPIGWFDLPFEMREMVIDNMDPISQCRFAQCSKQCEKEAKGSKNHLYGIGVESLESGEIRLCVYNQEKWPCDYYFGFFDAGNNQTKLEYRRNLFEQIDEMEENVGDYSKCWDDDWSVDDNTGILEWTKIESGKPNDVRIRYFKEYIEKYKRSIKYFCFDDDKEPIHPLCINKLKNLTILVVEKVRDDSPGLIESGFIDWDKLLRIKSLDVVGSNTYFTFENILNFTGESAIIQSNSLNQAQANEYLKMRKKGEIHEKLRYMFVSVGEPFDVQVIIQGLDVFDYSEVQDTSRSFKKEYDFSFRSDINKNGVFRFHYHFSLLFSLKWEGSNS